MSVFTTQNNQQNRFKQKKTFGHGKSLQKWSTAVAVNFVIYQNKKKADFFYTRINNYMNIYIF